MSGIFESKINCIRATSDIGSEETFPQRRRGKVESCKRKGPWERNSGGRFVRGGTEVFTKRNNKG